MLESNALDVWDVSLIWNAQTNRTIPVGEAIKRLNGVLSSTNPDRPLAKKASRLLEDIIHNAK